MRPKVCWSEHGLKDAELETIEASLAGLSPKEIPTTITDALRKGESVRVVYVGGNETQKKMQPEITSELKGEYPGLVVEFFFPGWSSRWNVPLEKMKPAIDEADIVVLNCLVRTLFGRHVRKYCVSEHPWRACTGRGKESLKRSIEQAAIWICSKKASDSTPEQPTARS